PNFVDPIYAYNHDGTTSAITGGTFLESNTFPAAYRGYYFADYLRGFIRFMNPATHRVRSFATGASSPVDVDVSPDGRLMYLAIFTGEVFQITPKTMTYNDQDGDRYTVHLSGPGQFALVIDNPDADGHGPISSIKLSDTDPAK